MGTLSLKYALPVSALRVDGTVTVTTDAVTGTTERAPEATVTLETRAAARDKTLNIQTGWFRNTAVGLELTDDGRLVSSGIESTGQLGKVVLGVVGAGVAIAGVALSPVGLAGVAAAAAVGGATTAEAMEVPTAPPPAPDPAIVQYRVKHAALDDLRKQYEATVEQAARRIGALGNRIVAEDDPRKRWALIAELRQLESVKPSLDAELDRLVAHFRAWRAAQVTSRVETVQRGFDLDELRAAQVTVSDAGTVTLGAQAAPAVRWAWETLGVAVTIDPPGTSTDVPAQKDNQVVVRVPRAVTLRVWEKDADGIARLREEKRHLVMDAACVHEAVSFRKSLWAKRAVNLKFSDLGAMTSYTHAADSGAAAAADTLGALPATVGSSLEQAVKINTQLEALRTGAATREAERLKQQVERKQKEIELAGLKATEQDAAELERLKQQAEMAEKRKTIGGGEPSAAAKELATLEAEKTLLDAKLGSAVARRKLAAETDLAALRLEIEQRKTRAKADELREDDEPQE